MNLWSEIIKKVRNNIQTYTIVLAMVGIWLFFGALTNGQYLSAQNVSNLFRQMTVTSFLAVGMVLVIVTGNIDLSVGKAAGFVSVIVAYLQANVWYNVIPNQPLLAAALSVFLGLLVGVLYGCLEGYVIAYLSIPAFIVTLGGLFIMRGGILLVTQGKTIPANQPIFSVIAQAYIPPIASWVIAAVVVVLLFLIMLDGRKKKREYGFELPPVALDLLITVFFSILFIGYVFVVNQYRGIQVPVLLLAVVAIIFSYVSNNTRFGRYAYAIGGNREAARLSGINIKKNIFIVFVLMGLLIGVAGVVLASYVGYGTVAAGEGYELDAIAAAILGGTSPLGGVGTVFGALIGSMIMTSLTNGLQIMNVQPAWQYLVKGAVLVLAVYVDVYFKKNRG
ncbi:MAG: sugar ABC transporter permease [Anaerolineaceae bacterium]|nr:sugar ABC transporter permease [Anaerolineaceae bacterium]